MKIAVIGGGTAGYIAAAHLSKYFPQFDLYHIYDSSIPTIGVGEGTIPYFVEWLNKLTNLSYLDLEKRCHVTRKFGIVFENWGDKQEKFGHNFYPIGQAYSYHISAVEIVNLLEEYVCGTKIDAKVVDLKSDGLSVNIYLADGTNLEVDLAIDARGFPKSFDENQVKLDWIPTNAALIRQIPGSHDNTIELKIRDRTLKYQSATRSIARPHGWVFTIPLTNRTTYGYIYNRDINTVSDIEADFDELFQSEGITYSGQPKHLTFPNFTQRSFFDGALLKIGNTASFLEPLEATAIGCILKQVEAICYWPLRSFSKLETRSRLTEDNLKLFNNHFLKYVYKMSIFVGWHYAMGSRFNTEFWKFASSNFYEKIEQLEDRKLLEEFNTVLKSGSKLPDPSENFPEFDTIASQTEKSIFELLKEDMPLTFGQWTKPSFTEVGYGIGYFSHQSTSFDRPYHSLQS